MILMFTAKEIYDYLIKISFNRSMSSINILMTIKIPKFIVGTKNFRIQILLIIRKEKNKRS